MARSAIELPQVFVASHVLPEDANMNSRHSELYDLVEVLYAAVAHPEMWPEFLGRISAQFRDASTILWYTESKDVSCNILPKLLSI